MFQRAAVAATLLFSISVACAQSAPNPDDACAGLAKLSLPNTKVVAAELVPAGSFALPGGKVSNPAEKALFAGLPAFCRVVLLDAPSPDSAIDIEVWMPAKGWNGKFRGQGNGGFAGNIDFGGLAVAVTEGYASAGTDTGHTALNTASWALGHPEKVIDFGYRSVHDTVSLAKPMVKDYYGSPAKYNYFVSCSDGGREALMEAQRYPDDYDGIVAGAPANNWTHLITSALNNTQAITMDPADYIPAGKIPAIDAAVRADCDSSDGVTDGVLTDPRECRFKPSSMICKDADSDQCLTAKQAHTLDVLYGGLRDSAGKTIFPGYLPGAEDGPAGWIPWIVGYSPRQSLMYGFATEYFKDMVYNRADWDYTKAVVGDALIAAIDRTAYAVDANDPDLRPFAAHGGKLILYHGWNDPAIPALSTIDYYEDVRGTIGPEYTDSFVRLFMVPGMQHCFGGPGATYFDQMGVPPKTVPDDAQHDIFLTLEAWVEKGAAPESLTAVKLDDKTPGRVVMSRPVCAYPLMPKYKGSGDTNDAANFTCAKE